MGIVARILLGIFLPEIRGNFPGIRLKQNGTSSAQCNDSRGKEGRTFVPTLVNFSAPASSPSCMDTEDFLQASVRDTVVTKVEKRFVRIRRQIIENDKRQRRLLQCIDLAIERVATGASIAELAKRHKMSEAKVRRYIENAMFLARSRIYEKGACKPRVIDRF